MNGRLTANRLAAANIRRHKGQYVTILIGIVLSMVFSSSAVFFLFSLKTSVRELNRQAYGSQDGILFNADAKLEIFRELFEIKSESPWLGYQGFLESNIKKTEI